MSEEIKRSEESMAWFYEALTDLQRELLNPLQFAELVVKRFQTQVEAERERCAKLAEDCPHVGEPCCYCGNKIATAIRNKPKIK